MSEAQSDNGGILFGLFLVLMIVIVTFVGIYQIRKTDYERCVDSLMAWGPPYRTPDGGVDLSPCGKPQR